jgi:superfamily II DNA or RNA helicase
MTSQDIQTLERVLTTKGYAIRKDSLKPEEETMIRKELTVSPLTNEKFGKFADSFTVFGESSTRFYIPRQWGLLKFGVPQANIIGEGATLSSTAGFSGKPFDYQEKIIESFMKAGGNGLICVPCGKGKTFMALAIAARLGKRFCIIVDKEFLLNQWKGEIESFFPGLTVGVLQGDVNQTNTVLLPRKSLISAELKALCKENGLKVSGTKDELTARLYDAGIDLNRDPETMTYDCTICMLQSVIQKDYPKDTFANFGLTIFDECHHLGAAHFSRVLQKVQTKWMLGLSATPTRDDGLTKVFEWFLGAPVYWEKTREPDATVAVYVKSFVYDDDPDYYEAPLDWKNDVIMARLLGKVIDYKPRTNYIARIIKQWIKEDEGRRILVLSERITHLEDFELLLKPLGVEIGYYIGGMKEEVREKSAASARIILATYAMASEAMNIKTLNAVVLASPRKKVEQSTGRILRIRPEQRNLEHRILDFIDSHAMYMGQWRKRLTYYKQCHYNMFQLDEHGTATKMSTGKSHAEKVDLNVCQFNDD